MADGKLEVDDVVIDAATELIPRLAFSKEGDHWEASETQDGSLVVAVDCTQDEAILSAGRARELMNHIQQLRKAAGLDLKDSVEVFFDEAGTTTESAVSKNMEMFITKFKGSLPLPQSCAPSWAIVLQKGSVEVGGAPVVVSICRPAVAAKDDVKDEVKSVLSTLEPSDINGDYECSIDGTAYKLKEGEDYWKSAMAKARSTKSPAWV